VVEEAPGSKWLGNDDDVVQGAVRVIEFDDVEKDKVVFKSYSDTYGTWNIFESIKRKKERGWGQGLYMGQILRDKRKYLRFVV
jgi:hypothetical protein